MSMNHIRSMTIYRHLYYQFAFMRRTRLMCCLYFLLFLHFLLLIHKQSPSEERSLSDLLFFPPSVQGLSKAKQSATTRPTYPVMCATCHSRRVLQQA